MKDRRATLLFRAEVLLGAGLLWGLYFAGVRSSVLAAPLAVLSTLILYASLMWVAGRLYDWITPPSPTRLRVTPSVFGLGVVQLVFAAFISWGGVVQAAAGTFDQPRAFAGLLGWFGGMGALCVHYALTVRTHMHPDRLVFERWLRPRLDVAMAEVVGSEIGRFTHSYRLQLLDGRKIGASVAAEDIWSLHNALKKAGKAVPADDELAASISRRAE